MQPGDVLLIDAGSFHTRKINSNIYKRRVIEFETSYLQISATMLTKLLLSHEQNNQGFYFTSSQIVKKNHIDSIRLVTSNYHVERSIVEFKSQNPELKIIPHPVYSENLQKKWWTSWQTSSLIFSEYNKFLYVYISSHLGLRG